MQGKELFEAHAKEWAGDYADSTPLDTAVQVAKQQIIADVKAGTVPATVDSFAAMHDYVDANYYGGAFDWPVVASETDDEEYVSAHAAFWDEVQSQLHKWIASGDMRKAI